MIFLYAYCLRARSAYLARGFGERLALSLIVKVGLAFTAFFVLWIAQSGQPHVGFPCFDNFSVKCQEVR